MPGRVRPAGIVLAFVCAAGCSSGIPDRNIRLARTHCQLGEDYLQKKKPFEAKRELRKALELDPENRDAYHLLGIIFFLEAMHKMDLLERLQCLKGVEAEEQREVVNEDFRRAEDALKKSVNMANSEQKIESQGLVYLANIAVHFKRYDEAIRLAKQALDNEQYGSRHLAKAAMGWAYYLKGDLARAGRELRQAVYDHPAFCLGRYRLAKVYYSAKQYDRSLAELEQAGDQTVCPIQEVPHLQGLNFMQKRMMDKAREMFEACTRMSPGSCLTQECRRLVKNASRGATEGETSQDGGERSQRRGRKLVFASVVDGDKARRIEAVGSSAHESPAESAAGILLRRDSLNACIRRTSATSIGSL